MSGAPISPATQQLLMQAEFLAHQGGITVLFSGMPNHSHAKDLRDTIALLQALLADVEAHAGTEKVFAVPLVEIPALPGGAE